MTTIRRRIKAPEEEWRPMHDTDGRYEVSDLGRVRSVPRAGATRGRVLTPKQGEYLQVTVSNRLRGQYTTSIHVEVLRAFHGLPDVGQQARHLNGDPHDNRAENLAWGTASENNHDRVRHGTHHEAAKTHCPAGHAYAEHGRVEKRGSRGCRECDRTRIRKQVKTSQEQERRGARQLGGMVRSGSGSKVSAKGDVRVPRGHGTTAATSGTLVEYKRTDSKGIRLTTVMLEKIRTEALLEGRQHLLGFELGGRDYVVVPVERYMELEEAEQDVRRRTE